MTVARFLATGSATIPLWIDEQNKPCLQRGSFCDPQSERTMQEPSQSDDEIVDGVPSNHLNK